MTAKPTVATLAAAQAEQAEAIDRIEQALGDGIAAMPSMPIGLHARLSKVQADIKRVPKTGKARVMKKDQPNVLLYEYDYATQADLFSLVRPVCAEHGVAAIISTEAVDWLGSQMSACQVWMTLRLMADGEVIEVKGSATGTDKGDRAVLKAQTSCTRYLVAQAFMIDLGDEVPAENDADAGEQGDGPRRTAGPGGDAKAGRTRQSTEATKGGKPTTEPLVTQPQVRRLFKLMTEANLTDMEGKADELLLHRLVETVAGVPSLNLIPKSRYDSVGKAIQRYADHPAEAAATIEGIYKADRDQAGDAADNRKLMHHGPEHEPAPDPGSGDGPDDDTHPDDFRPADAGQGGYE